MNKISAINVGILLIVSLFVFSFTGYGIVILNSQYVGTKDEITITATDVTINGNSTELRWTASLSGPKPMFGGASNLLIQGENEKIHINLSMPLNAKKSTIRNITIDLDGKKYGGDDFTGYFQCAGQEGEFSSMRLDVADIHFNTLNQWLKHLKMDGGISIAETKIVHNPDECKSEPLGDPLLLSIDDLKFQVDSPTIYKWSSKGGSTYEL